MAVQTPSRLRMPFSYSPLYLKHLGPATPHLLCISVDASADRDHFFPSYPLQGGYLHRCSVSNENLQDQASFILTSTSPCVSNHPKELQCLSNCRFLFRRTFRLLGLFRRRFIIVFPLDNSILLFDLGNIKRRNLQSGLLQHPLFNLTVCGIGTPTYPYPPARTPPALFSSRFLPWKAKQPSPALNPKSKVIVSV